MDRLKLASAPTILPDLDSESSVQTGGDWMVTVFNNETNTYEEVMTVLLIATGCTTEEAYIETWEIDHYGQCVVHRASQEECESVAEIVRTIGIAVETSPGQ